MFLPVRNAKKYERKDAAVPAVEKTKPSGSKDRKRKKDREEEPGTDAKKPKKAKKDTKEKKAK